MLIADLGDYGTLASNDLGVILGIHSDGQLEASESLQIKTYIYNSHNVWLQSWNHLHNVSFAIQASNWPDPPVQPVALWHAQEDPL